MSRLELIVLIHRKTVNYTFSDFLNHSDYNVEKTPNQQVIRIFPDQKFIFSKNTKN